MNKDMNKRPFSSRKRVLVGFAVVCVVLLAALGLGSDYMLRYALRPSMEHSHDLSWRFHNIIDENPQLRPWADSLQRHHALRDTFVTMATGERHHATYILAPRPTDRVALLVHGYEDNGMGMMHIASIYHHMGFNLLLPDLHAHGRSEGEAVQMGWLDRLDVMRWMEVANSRFGRGGNTRMVLHGVSMGAATVMCVSGETLPSYVKCFVEDCGYTSAWDEFEGELHDRFGLPAFPCSMPAAPFVVSATAGVSTRPRLCARWPAATSRCSSFMATATPSCLSPCSRASTLPSPSPRRSGSVRAASMRVVSTTTPTPTPPTSVPS